MSTHQHIGTFIKPHGLQGAITCHVDALFIEAFQRADMIFIDQDGSLVPYRILALSPLTKDRFKLTLEEIDSIESANALRARHFYMPQESLPKHTQVELDGFEVQVDGHGTLGHLVQIIEQSSQALIEVSSGEQSWLIPFVDDFIIDVDIEARILRLDLPDGLLDI